MWTYESPIGTFTIKYIPETNLYGTILNGILYETCDTPYASADNIFCHCIGCYEWDSLEGQITNVPSDLSEWIKN